MQCQDTKSMLSSVFLLCLGTAGSSGSGGTDANMYIPTEKAGVLLLQPFMKAILGWCRANIAAPLISILAREFESYCCGRVVTQPILKKQTNSKSYFEYGES